MTKLPRPFFSRKHIFELKNHKSFLTMQNNTVKLKRCPKGVNFDTTELQSRTSTSSSTSTPWCCVAIASTRYIAPLSSNCQPSCSATILATVPLPAPLGPSMVITGIFLYYLKVPSIRPGSYFYSF